MASLSLGVAGLHESVTQMEKDLREARVGLKKVSIVSKPARFYIRQIKKIEPELVLEREKLESKVAELRLKQSRLNFMETKIGWLQDEVGGPLFQNIEEFLASRKE